MTFDTLAPHYRWLETAIAGRVLQRAGSSETAGPAVPPYPGN